MAGSTSSSNFSSAPPAPKILLAKPSVTPLPGKFGRGSGADEETATHRSRLPSVGSLNLLSDSWDFHIDRFLPFLTENTDFTVVGVIGPAGVGKSTIMNEIYGFDGSSPGMLPPFVIQSDETRAMARHCTMGIEPRISAERFILLDTQPVFSPSVLAEMTRPDGSSTVPVLGGESLSAELAHELMSIQLGVLLASVCHILLVVSDGVHNNNMWRLMLTVDLLKYGIPDPCSLSQTQSSKSVPEMETGDKVHEGEEYMATPIFVHTKLQDQDTTPQNVVQLRKALLHHFSSSSFVKDKSGKTGKDQSLHMTNTDDSDPAHLNPFVLPLKNKDDSRTIQHESYHSTMWKLRDKVLSTNHSSFSGAISEREWLKNTAKIWELVKSSPIIADFSKMLVNSGTYRR